MAGGFAIRPPSGIRVTRLDIERGLNEVNLLEIGGKPESNGSDMLRKLLALLAMILREDGD